MNQTVYFNHTCTHTRGNRGALKRRIPEHKRDSSPVADHMKSSGHHVYLNNVDGIQILDQEVNWQRRGIKEVIHIRIMGRSIRIIIQSVSHD